MGFVIFASLLGLIIGAVSAYLPIMMALKKLPNAVDQMVTEQEAESLLNEELDQLILTFQQEIPMASTFLKGSLLDRLKSKARSRLMGLFPKIKNRFNYKLSHTLFPKIQSEAKKAAAGGALIGLMIALPASLLYSFLLL